MPDNIFIGCEICKQQFKTLDPLGSHLKNKHNITIKEYYDIYYKKENEGKCLECGRNTAFRKITLGYRQYCCKDCSYVTLGSRIKRSNMLHYGVPATTCLESVKEKVQKTLLKNYNVTNPMHSNEIKLKHKETNINRYGSENAFGSEIIKNKIKETNLNRYGVENPFQSEKVKEKIKETNIIKYNTPYYTKTQDYKDKTCETNLKKYGVEWSSQNYEIFCKQKSKYLYNNIKFDSSWELAYYIWLVDNKIEFKYQPECNFYYYVNGIKKRYFPDFYLNNEYIEIKGPQFLDENKNLKPLYNNQSIDIINAKNQCMHDNNIKILSINEIQPILKYIKEKYGKNYLKQFKNK